MDIRVMAIVCLLTAQDPVPTPWPTFFERDVVAAAQDYFYRYSINANVPLYDVVVAVHGRTAYVYGSVGVDGRGALLEKSAGLWHVVGLAKGQFSPSVFSDAGVSPDVALMAVKGECPPVRLDYKSMTADQRKLATHSYKDYVPARTVRGIEGQVYRLGKQTYRVCVV